MNMFSKLFTVKFHIVLASLSLFSSGYAFSAEESWWLKRSWNAGNGTSYSIDHDVPGPFSYAAIDKKDYSGVTLNIVSPFLTIMGHAVRMHAEQFEELTGAKVNVVNVDYDKLYTEALWGLKAKKYDIVVYGSNWLPDFHTYLEPLPSEILDSAQFKDTIAHYKIIASWGGVTYHVPIDGDRHYQLYRKDVFEAPEFATLYKQKTGSDLRPPNTWHDYGALVKFFHENKLAVAPIKDLGTESTNQDAYLAYQFIKRSAPYTTHPEVQDGRYFEVETMKPMINNPGYVEALQDFKDAFQYYSEQGQNVDLGGNLMMFANGQAAIIDTWDDAIALATDPSRAIRSQVRTQLSPGSKRVWNTRTDKWDEFDEVNYVPHVVWGFTSAVSKTSAYKEAAFDFLGFFSNETNHPKDLLVGHFGVNPYRYSDLEESFWVEKANWNPALARSYVATLKKINSSKKRSLDLIIYQSQRYLLELGRGVRRALLGIQSPSVALDDVAGEWEKITDNIGRDRQRKAYLNYLDLLAGINNPDVINEKVDNE